MPLRPPPTPPVPGGRALPSLTLSASPLAWRRVADIPTPRSEVANALVGSRIYLVGGFGGPTVVESYDPATNTWRPASDYPLPVDHAMAAAAAGQMLHVFGGYVNGVATARAFALDMNGDRWSEIASLPAPRAAGAAVTALNGRLYVVGGAASDRLIAPTYEYDPRTNTWRSVAPIPTPRDHLAAALLNEKVCAVGGRKLSLLQNLATFECYDPLTDRWERLPDAPTSRGGVGATVARGRLYFIGGEQPLSTFREVEIYDLATRAWSRGPDLPTPRHGLAVVTANATVFVLGGGPQPGGSQTPVCEALDVR